MKTVPVYEAKTRFSELLSSVERGEPVTITRRGHAVACLSAVRPDKNSANAQGKLVQEVFASLAELRRGVRLEGDFRDILSEGRD